MMICGVDEAGRGPVLGPMVVAAVMVDDDSELRMMNVRDSKKLTPSSRERLAVKIREIASIEIAVIPAEEIDEKRGRISLNEFEACVFASLIDRLSPQEAYVDAADVDVNRFRSWIKKRLSCNPQITCCHRADDKYPVVSAASIIAKTVRDQLIVEIQREMGFLESWLREKGDFPPHTRRSWKTAKRAETLAKNSRLTDWSADK
jgi:ribonuclease HII